MLRSVPFGKYINATSLRYFVGKMLKKTFAFFSGFVEHLDRFFDPEEPNIPAILGVKRGHAPLQSVTKGIEGRPDILLFNSLDHSRQLADKPEGRLPLTGFVDKSQNLLRGCREGAVAMCVGIDGAVSSRDEDAGSGSQVNRPVSKVLV